MRTVMMPEEAKCRQLLKENTNWQNIIRAQVSEIPDWKNMLMAGGNKTNRDNENVLYSQLFQQQKQMAMLEKDIKLQQERLAQNCVLQHKDDIEAFCMQDILRERIKMIEKAYIDLKCNFLNYLSNRA